MKIEKNIILKLFDKDKKEYANKLTKAFFIFSLAYIILEFLKDTLNNINLSLTILEFMLLINKSLKHILNYTSIKS